MLISVETYRNCDSPPDPLSPLGIRACSAFTCSLDPVIQSTFVGCVQAWRDRKKLSFIYTCKGRAVAQW